MSCSGLVRFDFRFLRPPNRPHLKFFGETFFLYSILATVIECPLGFESYLRVWG